MSTEEAQERIEKAIHVFEEADLVPVALLMPYISYRMVSVSAQEGIENTGIATSLPRMESTASGWGEFTTGWRNMTSFDDPRYAADVERILEQQPQTILFHVQDWNEYTKKFFVDYVEQSDKINFTLRCDDPEVNTPPDLLNDMTDTLTQLRDDNEAVGRVVYGVIPSGTWRGGDPIILGASVNGIFKSYWGFFLAASFFPLSFFISWRSISRFFCNGKKNKTLSSKEKKSTVSIIIPAFNEEKNIGKSIESALNQDYNGKLEVLVVNDGSTDNTAEIISKYPVKIINLAKNEGKARALNHGIKESIGDILIFSDGDSRLAPDSVKELVNCLEEHPDVGAVAGNILVNKNGKNSLLQYFQMIEYRTEQEINRYVQSVNGEVLVCPGPLFGVRRHLAEKIQFSDRSIIEDSDFTVELLKNSVKVIRNPNAKVYTETPRSLKQWFKQRKRWWYGNLQLWKLHKPWAKKNPWMILNYLGFAISLLSLIMMLLLPIFFVTYDNIVLILLRGTAYAITPLILFTILTFPFFIKEKRLLLLILPYCIFYATVKVLVVSYLYIRYLLGVGVEVAFGPRIIKVK